MHNNSRALLPTALGPVRRGGSGGGGTERREACEFLNSMCLWRTSFGNGFFGTHGIASYPPNEMSPVRLVGPPSCCLAVCARGLIFHGLSRSGAYDKSFRSPGRHRTRQQLDRLISFLSLKVICSLVARLLGHCHMNEATVAKKCIISAIVSLWCTTSCTSSSLPVADANDTNWPVRGGARDVDDPSPLFSVAQRPYRRAPNDERIVLRPEHLPPPPARVLLVLLINGIIIAAAAAISGSLSLFVTKDEARRCYLSSHDHGEFESMVGMLNTFRVTSPSRP